MNHLAISGAFAFVSSLIMAAFIFYAPPRNGLKTVWSLFGLSVSLWGLGLFFAFKATDSSSALFWLRFLNTDAILIPIIFFHFVVLFTNSLARKKTELLLYYTVIGVFFALCVIFPELFVKSVSPKLSFEFYADAGILYYIFPLLFGYLVVYGIIMLLNEHKKAMRVSVARSNQVRYFLIGIAVGFSGGSMTFLPIFGLDIYPIGTYFVPMHVITVTYAILKYRLMDIRVAITRAGLAVGTYAIVLGIPFYMAYDAHTELLPVFMMFVTATLGPLWYRSLQKKAENLLLAEQRRYQKVLLQAASGMAREHNLDRLLRLIVYVVDRTVRIEFAAIFLDDIDEGCYRLKAIRDHHKVPKNMTFGYDHPLIRKIKQAKEPLTQEEITPLLGEFMEKPVSMIVPSFTDDTLTGMLFLGEKRSRQMYTQDDINIFKIMAHQTALSISNCMFMQEFQKSQEKLFAAEKLAAVGGMAEGVAHQIRNRLNQFSVAAGEMQLEIDDFVGNRQQMIDSDPDAKRSLDYLKDISQSIVSNVKKTASVINGVLNFANVEHQETRFSVFPLSEIVPHALELLCVKHQLAAFPLETRIDSDDKIYGVKSQILECVYNILDNAFEAGKDKLQAPLSDEERKTYVPEVRMKIVQKESSALIAVSDNGIGIKDENKRKIFAPFYTTKPSVSSGTGIGLYVVKRMIEENHKGKIWFESEYLKGTTIYLELPRPQNGIKSSEQA